MTPEEFDARQRSGEVHPMTCGQRNLPGHPYEDEYGDHGALRMHATGVLFCPYCDYRQTLR